MANEMTNEANTEIEFDYIVVGSGAGGGPLASNLARAGCKVLLMEAGGDDETLNYQVPAFHGHATEDETMRWDYYVRHYGDNARQRLDSKYEAQHDGVLYPRAGTLGGCTAHNAMITVYPHNSDWDQIAKLTQDSSWNAENMRKYFQRLESCQYVTRPGELPKSFFRRLILKLLRFGNANYDSTANHARHGFDGWLTVNTADPRLAIRDRRLLKVIKAAYKAARAEGLESRRSIIGEAIRAVGGLFGRGESLIEELSSHVDPNDWRVAQSSPEGVVLTPMATRDGKRTGAREYILATRKEFPDRLHIRTHALATRVLFDPADPTRATGVEYMDGAHLYRADPAARRNGHREGTRREVYARKEVILSAGAFNSPQLLKLSGIGARAELERFGIGVRVDLPGVGENLQDRYEVGVVSELKEEFATLKQCAFRAPQPGDPPDPCLEEWRERGTGLYTTNGALLGIVKKSHRSRPDPDLFIFGLPGFFKGYFTGYSGGLVGKEKNIFTWAILKAHTHNTAGCVALRSADPRDVPAINFRYFDEGNDATGEDLASVVDGVKFVKRMAARTRMMTKSEMLPGVATDTDAEIGEWIKNEAWGHHASCTNKMGPRSDPAAVVDSDFRVHGTRGLRVVDASVFPRIPGFFIVSAVYMISEKATDAILRDAERNTNER